MSDRINFGDLAYVLEDGGGSAKKVDEAAASVSDHFEQFKEAVMWEWDNFLKKIPKEIEKKTGIKFEHGKVTGYPHGFGRGGTKWLSSIELINKDIPIRIGIGWDLDFSGTTQEIMIHTPDGKDKVSMEVGTTLDSVDYIANKIKQYG